MEFEWTWLFSLAVKPTSCVGVVWDILNNCPKSCISPTSLSINKTLKANCLYPHHMNWSKDWTPDFCNSETQTRLGIKLLCCKICKTFKEALLHFLLAAAICVWFVIVHLSCWPDGRKCYFQLSLCCSQEFLCCSEHAGDIQAFMPPPYPSHLARSGKGQYIINVVQIWDSLAMEIPRSKDWLCFTLGEDWFICHIPSTATQSVQKWEGALKWNEFAKEK